jgi:hypothetical protein
MVNQLLIANWFETDLKSLPEIGKDADLAVSLARWISAGVWGLRFRV